MPPTTVTTQASVTEKLMEPEIIILHTEEEIFPFADRVVDVFWERRRYGESWDGFTPPPELFSEVASSYIAPIEVSSRRVHRRLIFEIIAEMLRDMYRHEHEPESPTWMTDVAIRPKHRRRFNKEPPTTVDVLKPVMRRHVAQVLGVHSMQYPSATKTMRQHDKAKCGGRKKKDDVDTLLIRELRDEEPDWVDYESDVLSVKMQLVDTIFDELLADSVRTIRDITGPRTRNSQPSSSSRDDTTYQLADL